MEQMQMKAILATVLDLHQKQGDVDAADLAKAAGLTLAAANEFILKMEEENLADIFEIDMCCGADYVIKGITEKGKRLLNDR